MGPAANGVTVASCFGVPCDEDRPGIARHCAFWRGRWKFMRFWVSKRKLKIFGSRHESSKN